ncbi:HD domain-containing protein [Lutimaribacter marinistellae]|uniref:HD domain-containing protein n=1 Tax=Lutimaribacter marinistellae TaxID=1820329 RepID=A0ABV7TEF4_9RHOB
MSRIGEAFEFAFRAHCGQTDRAGLAYIGHVARVAEGVETEDEIVVALLHDVVEDTQTPLSRIQDSFGTTIADAVDAISRRREESEAEYLERVVSNPLALAVKRADVADNDHPSRMSVLDPETRRNLEKKYAQIRTAVGSAELQPN